MRRVWKWCVAGVMALMLAVVLGSPVSTQAAEKTYVIGTDVTYAPFEFADKNNQYVGIDIDLMQAIAKAEGFKVDIKPLGFNAAVQALEANQIDGVIAGMQITPERQQKFAMSDPYYKTAVAMAVGQNSEVKSLKDLRGKRVALKTGTAAADYALSLKAKYGFTTVTFDDSNNMYQDVITGNSVACFDDKPVLQYAIATGLKLKLAGPESKASYYGFATQKDRSDHLDQRFNAGLKKVKADGTYAKIVAKYLGNGTQAAQKQTSAKTQDSDRQFSRIIARKLGNLDGWLERNHDCDDCRDLLRNRCRDSCGLAWRFAKSVCSRCSHDIYLHFPRIAAAGIGLIHLHRRAKSNRFKNSGIRGWDHHLDLKRRCVHRGLRQRWDSGG